MTSPDLALAARWAGDRIVMLRKRETVTVIWLLAFRDTDSASRFAAVYRKVLDRMHGSSRRRIASNSKARRCSW